MQPILIPLVRTLFSLIKFLKLMIIRFVVIFVALDFGLWVQGEEMRGHSAIPENSNRWEAFKGNWMEQLKNQCFSGWPNLPSSEVAKDLFRVERDGIALRAIEYTSMGRLLRLYIAHAPGLKDPELVVLNLLDADGWVDFLATMKPGFAKQFKGEKMPEGNLDSFRQHQGMFKSFKWVMAYALPTGVGPTQLGPERTATRDLRFQALGHTIDSVRVWDARRAIQTLRKGGEMQGVSLWLQGSGRMAGVLTYAALFEQNVTRLDLHELPHSHKNGPFFFNVLRVMDVPQAVAMALERSKVVIYQKDKIGWEYPETVAEKLGWDSKLQLRSNQTQE